MTSENYGLRSKINTVDRVPVIFLGDEEEFYAEEIKEMILDALEEALKQQLPKLEDMMYFVIFLRKCI